MESIVQENSLSRKCVNISLEYNPKTKLKTINEDLLEIRKIFFQENYSKKLPVMAFELIFDKFKANSNYLKKGINAAFAYTRSESLWIAYADEVVFQDMEKYFNEVIEMTNSFQEINQISKDSSRKTAYVEFRKDLMYSVIVIFTSCILTVLVLLYWFRKEVKVLRSFKILSLCVKDM
jgi:hypothetical protein